MFRIEAPLVERCCQLMLSLFRDWPANIDGDGINCLAVALLAAVTDRTNGQDFHLAKDGSVDKLRGLLKVYVHFACVAGCLKLYSIFLLVSHGRSAFL
jgi:hypothetical protein